MFRHKLEERYDVPKTDFGMIKYSGDMFVPYMEVGDTFVPYMVVSFPLASNDLIIRWSYPLIIHDCHLIIIPCATFESLGSNANKYGCFKSRYLQNSP